MSDNRNDLPSPNAPNFNQRLRETIQTYLGRQGNPLDRGLTLRDLIDSGIIKLRDGFTPRPGQPTVPIEPGPGVVDTYEPDLTPPPTPTGFTATAAISNIIVEHDAPLYTQGHGHLRTRLYGKIVNTGDPLPTFADAAEIGQFSGTVYAHPSNPATTWRLWIKWETNDGVLSVDPAGGINGMEAVTGQDVSRLVQAMTGPGNPFKVVTEQMTLPDGTVVPVGTYTSDAFIHNGQITNAKIANLAVDNAKIANLSASKITAGTIAVGQWIASANYVSGNQGWAIWGNGNAEFGAAAIRGQLAASQINTEGLTIKHNGQVILGAGASLPAQFVTPDGGWLNSNLVPSINAAATTASWSGVSGAGKPADYATWGAPAGTYVGNIQAQDVESQANSQWRADQAQNNAINWASGQLQNKLNKAGDTISGRISFSVADGMFAGSDTNNGVYFGKDGLVGRKWGSNTFYINTAGDAIFSGTIDAATMNSGRINLQHSGGWDWGYARSYNKWWDDGQNGWVFARHADGSTFAEMRAGSNRIWMSNWNDCGIQFPGITMTNGGLTISQANVINTLQLAANAVTVSNQASGWGSSVSTTLRIPAYTTMAITALGSIESYYYEQTAYNNFYPPTFGVSIDGVGSTTGLQYAIVAQGETWNGYTIYAGASSYGRSITNNNGYDIDVTVTVGGVNGVYKSVTAFGFKR